MPECVFKSQLERPLSWARWVQSTTTYLFVWDQAFRPNFCMHVTPDPFVLHSPATFILLDLIRRNIWRRMQWWYNNNNNSNKFPNLLRREFNSIGSVIKPAQNIQNYLNHMQKARLQGYISYRIRGWDSTSITRRAQREERIPTRCNNIDDLLSISDVDYWLQSRHV